MRYLRTKQATDFQKEKKSGIFKSVLDRLNPNPDYQFHLVREWLVEFGEDDLPFREIGLGKNGKPVLAGPDDRNYGFWLDTNMKFDDFSGDIISSEVFEGLWVEWQDQLQSGSAT